jgi:DNA-binding response OmpR family regulator
VMLSALGTADDVALGMRLGADDYITKPFTLADLLDRVRRLVETSRLDAAALAFNELVRLAGWRAPEGRGPSTTS